MAALPRFNTPPQVIIGPGASDLVGEEARRLKARRVLLVTEPGIVRMGVADQVLSSLSKAGVAAATYDKVQPDPTDANVAEGLEIFRRDGCNLVVGTVFMRGTKLRSVKARFLAIRDNGLDIPVDR